MLAPCVCVCVSSNNSKVQGNTQAGHANQWPPLPYCMQPHSSLSSPVLHSSVSINQFSVSHSPRTLMLQHLYTEDEER